MTTKRRALKRCGDALQMALLFAVIGGAAWAFCSLVAASYREHQADDAWRHVLVQASRKSEAHRYFVHNWMQCSPLFTTKAACLASIRIAAAARGPAFANQVDVAAVELGLP